MSSEKAKEVGKKVVKARAFWFLVALIIGRVSNGLIPAPLVEEVGCQLVGGCETTISIPVAE